MALKLGELSVILKGDSTDLTKNVRDAEKKLQGVGNTANRQAAAVVLAMRDMERASRDAGGGFDRAGDAADSLDTKAMGFRDTLTGVQDGAEGARKAMSGDWGIETFLLLGFGVGDLASGFYNLLIPAMKSAVGWLKSTKVATLAQAAAQGVASAATKVAAATTWLLNAALLANPIGLIILGVLALVAVFVVLWVKFEGFREFWIATWEVIKDAALAVGRWFKDTLWGKWIKGAWDAIIGAGGKAVGWFKDLPGRLKNALSKVAGFVSAPFKSGFNAVSRAWNNTVGRLSWTVPSWVPGFGGNSISAPHLPMLAKGGHILQAGMALVGERGPELVHLGRGATVEPLSRGGGGGGGGGHSELRITGELRARGSDLIMVLRDKAQITPGGIVKLVDG
ncbi:hypothetical protein [Micromonospora sp. NPDC005367]|uniref:hypothetical protein n=1 Tax=Micromonospora sp. NPDC005367 TaxID=3155590 RepID=UPI0033ACDEB4